MKSGTTTTINDEASRTTYDDHEETTGKPATIVRHDQWMFMSHDHDAGKDEEEGSGNKRNLEEHGTKRNRVVK